MSKFKIEYGEIYTIKEINDFNLIQKFLNVGILPESKIEFIRKSPLGGTYFLKVDGNIIALRNSEVEALIVI